MNAHYQLPAGWTWRRVVIERTKWDISERFYPLVTISGIVSAWGRPFNLVDG